MKISQNLYELIASLSKSEKRYLRLFASLHGNNKNYLKLFDALQQTAVYDERTFLAQHAHEPFIQNFSFAKGYLYSFILKCLESFHANAAVKSEITGLLQKADVLFDKALYSQCLKQLRKAKRLAYDYSSHRLLLEVLNWELRVLLSPAYAGEGRSTVAQILAEEEKVLHELRVINTARRLRFGIKELYEKMPAAEENICKNLIFVKNRLDSMKTSAVSLLAQCETLRAYAFYYYYNKRWDEAIVYIRKEMENMEAANNILLDRTWLSKYIMATGLAADITIYLGKYDETQALLEKLIELSQAIGTKNRTTAHLSMRAKEQFYIQSLNLFLKRRDFHSAAETVNTIQAAHFYIKACENRVLAAQLHLRFAVTAYYNGNLEEALRWVNTVIHDSRYAKNDSYSICAVCLAFVVHFETGNHDSAEYILQLLTTNPSSDTAFASLIGIFKQFLRTVPYAPNHKLIPLYNAFKQNRHFELFWELNNIFDLRLWMEKFIPVE